MLMYSCGVQIARQEFQKLSSRILSLSHALKDTEVDYRCECGRAE